MSVFITRMKTHKTEDKTRDFSSINNCAKHGNKPRVLHIVAGKRKEDHYVVTCGNDECGKITMSSAEDGVNIWNNYNPKVPKPCQNNDDQDNPPASN